MQIPQPWHLPTFTAVETKHMVKQSLKDNWSEDVKLKAGVSNCILLIPKANQTQALFGGLPKSELCHGALLLENESSTITLLGVCKDPSIRVLLHD